MKDRISTDVLDNGAIRYGVYDGNGELLRYEYIKPEDAPTQTGSAISVANILPDTTAAKYGLSGDPQVKDVFNAIPEQFADKKFVAATGTGNAIIVSSPNFTLTDGNSLTFVALANNSGATTLQVSDLGAKPIYKPNTTTAPTIKAGKAVTVWYNLAGDCFFVKASATGDADVSDVVAGKVFSNDNDTDLVGTLNIALAASANTAFTSPTLSKAIPQGSTPSAVYTLNMKKGVGGTVKITVTCSGGSGSVLFTIGATSFSCSVGASASQNITVTSGQSVVIKAANPMSSATKLTKVTVGCTPTICTGS